MSVLRVFLTAVFAVLSLSSAALAQSAPQSREPSPLCKPDTKVEILSEGGWYPGVVLDALRDGRCFVRYDGSGEEDDEAVTAKMLRSAR